MEQKSQSEMTAVPIAIVGKSPLFPAAMNPKTFWPGVLGLKGVMSGLATGQWPFCEFFAKPDLEKLKAFVMSSGLLSSGGPPVGGFEIPPEVLKIRDVIPVLALFLAKQALEDTTSFQAQKIPAGKVKTALGAISENVLLREFQTAAARPVWSKVLRDSGLPEDQARKITESVALAMIAQGQSSAPETLGNMISGKLSAHYGFEVLADDRNAPLTGSLGLLGRAISELQDHRADLVIVGGIDCTNSIFCYLEEVSATAPGMRFREGMGMLVLRRQEDAQRDGDRVYAVITAIDASTISFSAGRPRVGAVESPGEPQKPSGAAKTTTTVNEASSVVPETVAAFLNGGKTGAGSVLGRFANLSAAKRQAFFTDKRYVTGAAVSEIHPEQSILDIPAVRGLSWLPLELSLLYQADPTPKTGEAGGPQRPPGQPAGALHGVSSSPDFYTRLVQTEHLSQFARLHPLEMVVDAKTGTCKNLPYNPTTLAIEEDNERLVARGSAAPTLDWKKIRDSWVKASGSRRFFHDLLGALMGTFVNRVVLRQPDEFWAVASQPVIYMANHQIGLESPLFMTLSYAMTGNAIEAIAKPDHVNAWLAFLMAFAEDSLGIKQPFRIMYFDKLQPQTLIDSLKKEGKQEASVLIHVEGTRSVEAGQPVTKISSIFLDMAIAKNIPIVPVRFTGGLPSTPSAARFDFPHGNGKQDYFIGGPIFPEELKKMYYGQRPKYVMEKINSLGPLNDEDVLLPPSKKFEEKTRFYMDTFGAPKMQALLFAILGLIDDPCEETAVLMKAIKSGKMGGEGVELPPVLKNFLSHVKNKLA